MDILGRTESLSPHAVSEQTFLPDIKSEQFRRTSNQIGVYR